ncbi:hypothetical protein GCM10027413_03900 [Conyzicola nivalis]|uniref:DUF624 domain-containing protein n=1 Tax=Conyzicola nivalis TaxID=1477021 RepID=A0A916WK43_9MICO|nr:hypothetical protein [Conyzicola nivalis]GGB07667.1 hypothetical protein GCM10010979_22740 [Conyzicola nivalis]
MTIVSTRRAKAQAASGSGPTSSEAGAWPGAKQRFALFGEVLLTGIIVVLVSIPIVTIPLALAVGKRHLMRFLRAEGSQLALVAGDVREGFIGGVGIGCAWLAATGILLMDLLLVASGALPGGVAVGALAVVLLAALTVLTLWVAASWTPASGWRAAVRTGFASLRTDPIGSVYLLVGAGLVVLFTWMLPPLIIPALGCVCFAVAAIAVRHAARRA